jgi:uncharacterized protein (DUF58 family)
VTPQAFVAILLLLAGSYLGGPVLILLGVLLLLLELVRQVWARRGLYGVSFRRGLARNRMTVGDEVRLDVEVWNGKELPLAWLRADDRVDGSLYVRERELVQNDLGGNALRNTWTLAPFERVTRHFHVGSTRRGAFDLGPVELVVGDVFAREADRAEVDDVLRLLVRPRSLPIGDVDRRDRWGGVNRARYGLTEDPTRFAGVRDYQPGDPLRRIHQRASARLGRPVVKRFEPARHHEVLIALDIQTAEGPAWQTAYDEAEVESLIVVAASIARRLGLDGVSFGLAAAGYSDTPNRLAFLAPSAAAGQVERALDLLARLSPYPSAPFERLLGRLARIAQPDLTILVLTARDPIEFIPVLRRMRRTGFDAIVVGCGREGGRAVERARANGLDAVAARLDGSWRSAGRVELAS